MTELNEYFKTVTPVNETPFFDFIITGGSGDVIYPERPCPEFEKWDRGRPSKEMKAKREEWHKWRSEIKIKYKSIV